MVTRHAFISIETFYIAVRGILFITKLPRDYMSGELEELNGQEITMDGARYLCVGVQTYAISVQSWPEGESIALLCKHIKNL